MKNRGFIKFDFRGILLSAVLLVVVGCSSHDDERAGGDGHGHAHAAPHGGCLVMLGNHAAQLELVAEENGKRFSLYALDGGAEYFVRLSQPEIAATLDGRPATFRAVENAATGESAGNTAQFAAETDWLAGKERFSVEIAEIVVRGQAFTGVSFVFPEGKH